MASRKSAFTFPVPSTLALYLGVLGGKQSRPHLWTRPEVLPAVT